MPTRRGFLTAVLASAVTVPGLRARAAAPQPRSRVKFTMPPGACDCHAHVFGDPRQFPLSPSRTYTPPLALPSELARLHRALHVRRAVVVTASAYGTNNGATLSALKSLGRDARAVVVIDEATRESQLDEMHAVGARGVRLFLGTAGADPAITRTHLEALAQRASTRNWHVQIFTNLQTLSSLKQAILAAPAPIVVDHFGGARGELGPGQPGFSDLLDMVRSGKVYVKLSAAYRFSRRAPHYEDMVPLARALIEANPDRMLWATDWPHTAGDLPGKKPTDIFPFIEVDDAQLLNLLPTWAPDPAVRKKILVSNPARLYGF